MDPRRGARTRWVLAALVGCVALLVFAPGAFALEDPGAISGTVTEHGKTTGLENISVVAIKVGPGEVVEREVKAQSNGAYKITELPGGNYKVLFKPGPEENYLPQYYEGKRTLSSATEFLVVESSTREGINAELQEGGEISGMVTNFYTHRTLAGVTVFAYASVGAGEEAFVKSAETNANGEYTMVGLESGTYVVEFTTEGQPHNEYITQFYNGQPSFAKANLVTAVQGSTTPGVNVALAPKVPVNTAGPVVSGTPEAGHTLSCSTGSWTGEGTLSYSYVWLRNGVAIASASGSQYGVQAEDQGHGLACKVTATNKFGSASAVSNTLTVQAPKPPPPHPHPHPHPHPVPKPEVRLLTAHIVASGYSAGVPIACAKANCTGRIELTEQIVVRHRHHHRRRFGTRTLVLGKGSYSLTAGQSATIVVHLTLAGDYRLAVARHHRLQATARVSVKGGAAKYVSIVLSERPRRHRRHRRR